MKKFELNKAPYLNIGPTIFGVFCVMGASMPLKAGAQEILNPSSIELSPIMEILTDGGINFASQTLAIPFYDNAIDDQIIIADMSQNDIIKLADRRAQKVYGYLQIDLNWDGQVTKAELAEFFASSDHGFVAGYLNDGDLDGDGVITLAEMLTDAGQERRNSSPASNGYLAEMLTWDLNQDGILLWDEVLQVLVVNQP